MRVPGRRRRRPWSLPAGIGLGAYPARQPSLSHHDAHSAVLGSRPGTGQGHQDGRSTPIRGEGAACERPPSRGRCSRSSRRRVASDCVDLSIASSVEPLPLGSGEYGRFSEWRDELHWTVSSARPGVPTPIQEDPGCPGSKAPGRRSPKPRSSAPIAFASSCDTTAMPRPWLGLKPSTPGTGQRLRSPCVDIRSSCLIPLMPSLAPWVRPMARRSSNTSGSYVGRRDVRLRPDSPCRPFTASATPRLDVPTERRRSAARPDVAPRQVSALGSGRRNPQSAR